MGKNEHGGVVAKTWSYHRLPNTRSADTAPLCVAKWTRSSSGPASGERRSDQRQDEGLLTHVQSAQWRFAKAIFALTECSALSGRTAVSTSASTYRDEKWPLVAVVLFARGTLAMGIGLYGIRTANIE